MLLFAGFAAAAVSGCATGFVESPPTSVMATSATLNGSVGSNRSEQGLYWFEYGPTTAYGRTTPQRTITYTSYVKLVVSEAVSGLAAGTAYHYRGGCPVHRGTSVTTVPV
jgi:hypothetical protein